MAVLAIHPGSVSNVSTSLLCYSAVKVCSADDQYTPLLLKLGDYLRTQNIDVNSEQLISAILDFYKTDRTFSVPILTMCALCGVPGKEAFESIPQLPFELSLLPPVVLSDTQSECGELCYSGVDCCWYSHF